MFGTPLIPSRPSSTHSAALSQRAQGAAAGAEADNWDTQSNATLGHDEMLNMVDKLLGESNPHPVPPRPARRRSDASHASARSARSADRFEGRRRSDPEATEYPDDGDAEYAALQAKLGGLERQASSRAMGQSRSALPSRKPPLSVRMGYGAEAPGRGGAGYGGSVVGGRRPSMADSEGGRRGEIERRRAARAERLARLTSR